MNLWKRLLLSGYVHSTLPWRHIRNRCASKQGQAPIIVLFYHRIADVHLNPWTMPNSMFLRQVEWLSSRFDMVSLAESQRRMQSGDNQRPCVTLTFDDGYADNCLYAVPLLIKRRIPCTYFVSTRYIFSGTPFPHDVAAGQPLAPNTIEQLKAMADAGVDIGAHTRTHPNLGSIHNRRRLHDEIAGSRDDLREALRRPINYFSFPFGLHENMNQTTFSICESEGFSGVCSAYGAYNTPGQDPFHLQRIHGDTNWIRFINWLTIDPRKQSGLRPFELQKSSTARHAERQIETSA